MTEEPIRQATETILSRLRPLKEAPPSMVSEVVVTFVCSKCGTEAEKKVSSEHYRSGERRSYECAECKHERRALKFKSTCPLLYQESDIAQLPRAQYEQGMSWQYGPRGIVLIGDTGKGKSRIAWMLLRRVLVEDKSEHNFMWFDCIGFGHEIARHYRLEDAEQWLDKVAEVPLLFFDDLGKLKMTERAETELFGLIERRCANQLPIIATTNDTGDSLAARMTENRGPALIRRLREFCEIIQF